MFPGDLRYRFLFGRGMVSDDTEHACITALALARAKADDDLFARLIASGLRRWLATIPAGAGLATLKSTLKLWVGVSPRRSGVPSAGNGPAMRAAIIGTAESEPARMRSLCEISSRITHTDPRAIDGAYLVALAASGQDFFKEARQVKTDCWRLDEIEASLKSGKHPSEFAKEVGLEKGVTGFIAHTVPAAIYCSMWAGSDFKMAIQSAAGLGGDSDTVCAIVGGIVGAKVGFSALPQEWVGGLWEWPRSVSWMRRLADTLASGSPPPRTFWLAYVARSPLFIGSVLTHGFRRLLPPY